MSYNGSGTFVINTAGQPVVSGTVISSTAFNALTADLATGLSTAITKDGQTTPTANIPMGNNKITNLAVGTAATDAANLSQVQSTTAKLVNSISGADTITGTMSPTLGAYATGQMFYFIAAGDNTGAVTLNIDSLGAKAVTRDGSVALAASDLKSGEVVVVVYDGTRFQVVSQLNSAGDARFANVSITSALNVGGVATFSAGTAAAPSITTSGDTNTGIFFPAADTIAFAEGGVEAARFDSAGNFGLGTSTPDAPIQIAKSSATSGVVINAQNTTTGSLIQFACPGVANLRFGAPNADAFVWQTFGSGSYPERMRLDSSGNLLVGSTSSSAVANKNVDVNGTGDAAFTVRVGGTTYAYLYATASTALVGSPANIPFLFYTNGSERARITSGGNFGIGTSSPGEKLEVAGNIKSTGNSSTVVPSTNTQSASFISTNASGNFFHAIDNSTGSAFGAGAYGRVLYSSNAYPMAFFTNDTERARIASGGELLVNATSQPGAYKLYTSGTDAFHAHTTQTGGGGTPINVTRAGTSGTANLVLFASGGSGVGSISTNGTTTSYNTSSDRRLKENIVPADDAGDVIDAIEVVKHDWKNGGHTRYGVIAQDLNAVAPEAVAAGDDGDEIEKTWGVDYSKLVPMLVKEIQSLRARVAQLEAK